MSSDDDEDNFAIYGTPLEEIDEDNLPRKKPIQIEDQVVKDEHGRRRFHGAFTGGFTAGFFNTAGSLEGWTPTNFVSSRDKKFDHKNQTIHDFMDDEDKGEFGICPTTVKVKPSFDSIRETGKRDRYQVPSKTVSGILNVQEILKPVKETVGIKLLMKMGWKPGQGVGPRLTRKEKLTNKKVYGCAIMNEKVPTNRSDDEDGDDDEEGFSADYSYLVDVTFAPDEYSVSIPKPKDNTFGLGYVGISREPVLSSIKQKYSRLTLDGKSIHGQAFGVGAYEEEDEDIYAADDMSQYDFGLGPVTAGNKSTADKNRSSVDGGCIDGFYVVRDEYHRTNSFTVIKVPEDFVPFHQFKKSRFDDDVARNNSQKRIYKSASNVEERSLMLGNVARSDDKYKSQNVVVDLPPVKTEDVTALPVVVSLKPTTVDNSFKPFQFDPDKQKRYEKFLNMNKSNNKELLSSIQPAKMTDWERLREKLEFGKAAKLFTTVSSDLSARFTGGKLLDDATTLQESPFSQADEEDDDTRTRKEAAQNEMYGFLTRREYKFIPCKLLCQRFNVPQPDNRCDLELCPDTVRKNKRSTEGIFSILESDMFANTTNVSVENVSSHEKSVDDVSAATPVTSVTCIENTDTEIDIIPSADNNVDLFKAIFLDSSDDDTESEETSESNIDRKEPVKVKTDADDNLSSSKSEDYAKKIIHDILRPSGIFANIDFDALKADTTARQATKDGENQRNLDDNAGVSVNKNNDENTGTEDTDSCPNVKESYGPVLPDSIIYSTRSDEDINGKRSRRKIIERNDEKEMWVEKSTKHKHHYTKKKKRKKDKKKHSKRK